MSAAGEHCNAARYDILDRSYEDASSAAASSANFLAVKSNERSIACRLRKLLERGWGKPMQPREISGNDGATIGPARNITYRTKAIE
jgi:hypothetical protein